MAAIEVEAILAGEVAVPHSYLFRELGAGMLERVGDVLRGQGGAVRIPLLWFVVRHPRAGVVLVDTGLHAHAAESVRRAYGPVLGSIFRGLRPAPETFEQQLLARGISAETVRLVVMTHLHADHTGGMALLPNAEFICSAAERDLARRPRSALNGYVGAHLPAEARMRLVDLDSDGTPLPPFSGGAIDVLGDGSMRLVSTPGHTRGHCSVLLRGAGGRDVLLVGDAAYTLRSIRDGRLPAFTASDRLATRTLHELKAFADAAPDTLLVPTHDPTAWWALAGAEAERLPVG